MQERLDALGNSADELCIGKLMWFTPSFALSTGLPDVLAARVLNSLGADDVARLTLACSAYAAAVAQLEDAGLLRIRPPVAQVTARVRPREPSLCLDGGAYVWDGDTLVRRVVGITRKWLSQLTTAPPGLPGCRLVPCGPELHLVGLDAGGCLGAWRCDGVGVPRRVAAGVAVHGATEVAAAQPTGDGGFLVVLCVGRARQVVAHLCAAGSAIVYSGAPVGALTYGSPLFAVYDAMDDVGMGAPHTFIFDAAALRAAGRVVLDLGPDEACELAALKYDHTLSPQSTPEGLLVAEKALAALGATQGFVSEVSGSDVFSVDGSKPLFTAFQRGAVYRAVAFEVTYLEDLMPGALRGAGAVVWVVYQSTPDNYSAWRHCYGWRVGVSQQSHLVAMHPLPNGGLLLVLACGTLRVVQRRGKEWVVRREATGSLGMEAWRQHGGAAGGSILMRSTSGVLHMVTA